MIISELQTLGESEIYYSDIPANFTKSNISNDLSAAYDLLAVQNSMVGIIKTNKGERPFNPEYGSNITSLLFELMTPVSTNAIKRDIQSAIKTYEPRVLIKNVVVLADYDNNTYNVTIEYHLYTDIETLYATKFKLQGNKNG